MDGMHSSTGQVNNNNVPTLTVSYHYEQPALNTIGQLSISSFDEDLPQQGSFVVTSFTQVQFIDTDGSTKTEDTGFVSAISRSKLTRVDWEAQVSNGFTAWLLNLFYWPQVT
ncbi:hypothetical protein ACWIG3_16005 [Streptomyces celluloflavus]|uniref:Uncharacterized protein n=1 Tax=Streptomyces kasugaensis TaxID=1946 RepID=A0A4V6MU32_STRKA|nr:MULTISPECIES: hypothetical protein [Streptomyces]MYU54180.1 hypothetical protein [Streptomyces sp. SID7805]TBO59421.1 hypothetical protein EYS09_12275 [Streptomyces kasugaensis]